MDIFPSNLNKITFADPLYKWEYKPLEEDKEMWQTKEYKHKTMKENDKKALDKGLIREDGSLTEAGKDFLLNVLFEDKEVREVFDKAVELLEEK